MTTSRLLGRSDYCAEAHVEQAAKACVISLTEFEAKLGKSDDFHRLVFSSFSSRLAAKMAKIEAIAFTPGRTPIPRGGKSQWQVSSGPNPSSSVRSRDPQPFGA